MGECSTDQHTGCKHLEQTPALANDLDHNPADPPQVLESQALETPRSNFFVQQWRRFALFYRTHVCPDTVCETGACRLVTLDFFRGISTFVMLLFHTVNHLASKDMIQGKISTGFERFVVYVILAVVVVFGSMRSLFVYVSGFSFALTFVKKLLSLDLLQGLIETAKQLAVHAVLLPLMLYLSYLEGYFTLVFEQGMAYPQINTPWWKIDTCCCCNPICFTAIMLVIAIPVLYLVVVPIKLAAKSARLQHYLLAYVIFALGEVLLLVLPLVRHAMNLYVSKKYGLNCFSYVKSCNLDRTYNTDLRLTEWQRILVIFEASIAFIFTPIFPFSTMFFVGISCGVFILLALSQGGLSRKRRMTEFLVNYAVMAAIGLIMVGPNYAIQKHYFAKEGVTTPMFNLLLEPVNWDPQQDVVSLHVPFCIALTLIPMSFYEFSRYKKTAIQNTVFIRRFSTYSLTFYVFEGIFSTLAKSIFAAEASTNMVYSGRKMTDVGFLVGLLAFQAFILSMVSIVIDSGKGAMTVEWVLKCVVNVFRPGRPGHVSDSHLRVRPMTPFELND